MIRVDIMISRDAIGLPKKGLELIESEAKKRITRRWPDALIRVRKGSGNQISVAGLQKSEKKAATEAIQQMFDEAEEWLYIEDEN